MTKYLTKVASLALLMTLITGCVNNTNVKTPIDRSLPTIIEIRTLTSLNEIALEWTPINDERIEGYYIYRSNPTKNDKKLQKIATIDDKYSSHFTDKSLIPGTSYTYAISTFAYNGQRSPLSPSTTASTTPRLESVSFIQAISDLPNMIKIIWRPHTNPAVSSYVIQRRKIGAKEWFDIGSVNGRLSAEFIDKDLNNNKSFEYRVLARTNQGLLSNPSIIVNAKTKPLPFVVEGLNASTNEPMKITIKWKKSPNKDIAHYNVYSSRTSIFLYTFLGKTTDTSYIDDLKSNGTSRYYKVTAVDKDGLESPKQEDGVVGQSLNQPSQPSIVEIKNEFGGVSITWNVSQRAKSYTIIKTSGDLKTHIKDIKEASYIDLDVQNGQKYTYRVICIDKFGLKSDPSDEQNIIYKKQ